MNKITIEHAFESNDSACSEKSHNGGGYSQPYVKGVVVAEDGDYNFVYCDNSCGDFGRDLSIAVEAPNGDKLALIERSGQFGDEDFCSIPGKILEPIVKWVQEDFPLYILENEGL